MLPEKKKLASTIMAKMDGDQIKAEPEGGDVLDIIADDIMSAMKSGSSADLKAALKDFISEVSMEPDSDDQEG